MLIAGCSAFHWFLVGCLATQPVRSRPLNGTEEDFCAGDYNTHFLEGLDLSPPPGQLEELVAAIAAVHRRHQARRRVLSPAASAREGWLSRSRQAWSDHTRRSTRHGGVL